MRGRLILSALLKSRNLGTLIILIGLSSLLTNPEALATAGSIPALPDLAAYSASGAIYLLMTIQTLGSKKFHEEFENSERIREIKNLSKECTRLSRRVIKNTNTKYSRKLKKIIKDKDDIYAAYLIDKDNYLKGKITEQTLSLIRSYITLLDNFCIRSRELSNNDRNEIYKRININKRKADFARDPRMAAELKKLIDVDERLLERMQEEERELEKIAARLDYMESTVNMFKHQIITSIGSDELLEKLEKAVIEAEALDSVLENRRKNKRKA